MYDADIEALIEGRISEIQEVWTLDTFHSSSGQGTMPAVAVRLRHADGRVFEEAATGDGPVDALFKAIERIAGTRVRLRDYHVRSVTVGEDAQGEVSLEVSHGGRRHRARAVSTDIIEASARAFLKVINRIETVAPEGRREHEVMSEGV